MQRSGGTRSLRAVMWRRPELGGAVLAAWLAACADPTEPPGIDAELRGDAGDVARGDAADVEPDASARSVDAPTTDLDAAMTPFDGATVELDAPSAELDAGGAELDARSADPDAGGAELDAGPPALPACPSFASATTIARTPLLDVRETSGIVESRLTRGLYWLHNDSGDSARIFAVDSASFAAARATYTFPGVTARDWEDIAVGPGPAADTPYLYIGDIGDNGESRGSIQVYRVREPASPSGSGSFTSIERFDLVYPDRAHNAETLMVDPRTGDLYIVVKAGSGVSPVYRAPAPLATGVTITLDRVVELRFGEGSLPGDTTTTGGDISASGAEILIRTYDSAYLWRRGPDATIAEALATEPCRVPLASEGQGEAIGFTTDESAYVSTGEGSSVALSSYARR